MAKSRTLKLEWQQVKFGDVVKLSNARCSDPVSEGIEHYVGLEHIDSDDLRIRRWGLVEDGITFTTRFKPGQVLFGKRRAYLRKVAVADFEGICSGDVYVFESANPSVLLPELLPFICQTERFFEYAINTSAGSLSPRTNWKSLVNFEFALPPLEEQRHIAKALRSFNNVYESHYESCRSATNMFNALLWQLMQHGDENEALKKTKDLIHPESWPAVRLDSIAKIERGKFSHRPRNLPQFYGGPYPFVQTGDVGASRGYLRNASQFLSEEGLQYSRSFPKDSVLLTIAAVIGATAITTQEIWCTDSVVGIVPNQEINVRFLEYVLRYLRPHLELKVATQTAQKNINLEVLRPLLVPSPPKTIQEKIASYLIDAERAIDLCEVRREEARQAMNTFINSVLT